MSVIAYIRCSTSNQQDDGFSLETQRSEIETYVKRINKKLEETNIYIDVGTGRSMTRRHALKRMLDEIKKDDIVIVFNFSRLGRSLQDLLIITKEIIGKGAKFTSIKEDIDCTTPTGQLMMKLLFMIAEWESEQISQRVKATMHMLMSENKLVTKPPFGYCKGIDKGEVLQINEDEQKIIRYIMELHDEGNSYTIIANLLNDDNVKCRKAHKWRPDTVKRIIIRYLQTSNFSSVDNTLSENTIQNLQILE